MRERASRWVVVAPVVVIAAMVVTLVAAPESPAAPARPRRPAVPTDGGGDSPRDGGLAPSRESLAEGGTAASSPEATEAAGTAGDGGSRVFRFGEMEIQGRLRNPQLVYFLRRVRAEFAAEDLGHRTFLPELEETRRDRAF